MCGLQWRPIITQDLLRGMVMPIGVHPPKVVAGQTYDGAQTQVNGFNGPAPAVWAGVERMKTYNAARRGMNSARVGADLCVGPGQGAHAGAPLRLPGYTPGWSPNEFGGDDGPPRQRLIWMNRRLRQEAGRGFNPLRRCRLAGFADGSITYRSQS